MAFGGIHIDFSQEISIIIVFINKPYEASLDKSKVKSHMSVESWMNQVRDIESLEL